MIQGRYHTKTQTQITVFENELVLKISTGDVSFLNSIYLHSKLSIFTIKCKSLKKMKLPKSCKQLSSNITSQESFFKSNFEGLYYYKTFPLVFGHYFYACIFSNTVTPNERFWII